GLIIEAARLDQPADSIISPRVMAVPDDHARALTLAAALAQKCQLERLYARAKAEIDSTKRAAKLVSSEFRRQQRGSEEILHVRTEQFETAVNNMPHGLCMFDADAQLVVCNNRYAEMYSLAREFTQPGVTHEDIVRHKKDRGSFAGDADHYCDELKSAIVN